MKIAFLVHSVDISGGTYVIFEHATRMNNSPKNNVTIVTETKVNAADFAWHPEAKSLQFSTINDSSSETFDIVIITWWRTAYEAHRLNAHQYCYFVQSIESKFYDKKELPLIALADSTYMLKLPIITEATWIKDYLSQNYFSEAFLVKNGIRKDIYNEDGISFEHRSSDKLRVLVEGALGVSFKNVEKTLELCKKSKADEVWLMTSSHTKDNKLADKVFSKISIFGTACIYRSCDLVVKLSYVEGMFGPPLEMFHCGGTAIVYHVNGCDEYMVHEKNSFIVEVDDEQGVIKYINALKENPLLLQSLKLEARETAAKWHDWDEAALEFEESLHKIMLMPKVSKEQLAQMAKFFFDWYVIAESYKLKTKLPRTKIWQKNVAEDK